jgi:Ca-activated chloride channel homolog
MSAHFGLPIGCLAFSFSLVFALGSQDQDSLETISVRVSVTDPLNRPVRGLQQQYFRIYEDNVKQEITHFGHQTSPISIGVVYDVSGSMRNNNSVEKAKSAILRFLKSGNPDDEHSLIAFNQQTKLVQIFRGPDGVVEGIDTIQKPGGKTALYDAIYLALDQINRTRNKNKNIILITDGEDISSRYKPAEVREFANEADVQVYAIDVKCALGSGWNEIQQIVGMTGGKVYCLGNFNELDWIRSDLRNQYLLSYSPINKSKDGKWRKITVKVDPPAGLPKMTIRAREGRYAPKN